MFQMVETNGHGAKIRVAGVGGGGGNALNNMVTNALEGVDFICVNTDSQALQANHAGHRIQIGTKLTRGLGAGANPEIGWKAAHEDQAMIAQVLEGSDMVFVTAGMGGGTGTGAAPVIARIAKDMGALTVGVVTKPFDFEGKQRRRRAEEGIKALAEAVDTLIVIPNQRLMNIAQGNMSLLEAFRKADEVLLNAVRGISDLIMTPGLINVDFADVKTIMQSMGMALMGTGVGTGPQRAMDAAQAAICGPLLEDTSIDGATGILINITGGSDMTLNEVTEATSLIQEAAHEDANIIWGTVIDPAMRDEIKITVVATGFDRARREQVAQWKNGGSMGYPAYPGSTMQQQSPPQLQAVPPYIRQDRGGQAQPHFASPQVPAAAQVPDPVYTVAETTLDRPTFLREGGSARPVDAERRAAPPAPPAGRGGGGGGGGSVLHRDSEGTYSNPFTGSDQSEFDTPTFLRRQ